jgi:arabinogalactan endo-1,4-beta-galactosidase
MTETTLPTVPATGRITRSLSSRATPENENGGDGTNAMYNYVKQEIELFRANGAMPDLVALGNEVNLGMFTNLNGANYTPGTSGTSAANAAAIQIAGMQAILDASSDTSKPAPLGPPLPAPLRCMGIDGTPDLQTFFNAQVNTYHIPLDTVCQSYYPGWHGPLTQAQSDYASCGNTNCSGPQHIEEADIATEATGVGLPVFTVENGVAYTNIGGETPLEDWYGSLLLDTPNTASRNIERQSYIDLNSVEKNAPNNLGMGMDCWACETTPLSGNSPGKYFYWTSAQLGLFDNSASTTPGSLASQKSLDNATLPSMMGLEGKLDTTLNYKFVSAVNGSILETSALVPPLTAQRWIRLSIPVF